MCSGADNRQKYNENKMSRGLIRAVCASVCWPAGLTKLPNTCSGLQQMRSKKWFNDSFVFFVSFVVKKEDKGFLGKIT
jgi:hypothetical protein